MFWVLTWSSELKKALYASLSFNSLCKSSTLPKRTLLYRTVLHSKQIWPQGMLCKYTYSKDLEIIKSNQTMHRHCFLALIYILSDLANLSCLLKSLQIFIHNIYFLRKLIHNQLKDYKYQPWYHYCCMNQITIKSPFL